MAASITLHIDEKLNEEVNAVAETTQRPESDLAVEALQAFVESNAWLVDELEQAVRQAEEVGTVADEEVEAWMLSWGTDHELPMPKPRLSIAP